jgi:trehalose 6-phosphate phosphatase
VVRELTGPLRAAPERSALLFDFDGTLSAIVEDPAAAVPWPGVVERLAALAERYRVVGVVSGRPVAFLAGHLPGGLALSGLYGLEAVVSGEPRSHPEADRWRAVVEAAATGARAAAAPGAGPAAGMVVEAKGLSITLHYRTAPAIGPAVERVARDLAAVGGLEVRTAKMSVELHPPIRVDKGTVVEELAAGCDRVLFVGDDVGDLPAFEALGRLAAGGVAAARVVVRTAETAPELVAVADLEVEAGPGVLALLDALLG